MARVVVICADLMLGTRIEGLAAGAGHDATLVDALDETAEAEVIVADLDLVDPADLVATGVPTIGFYQHTDVDTRRAAESAGLAIIAPRSKLFRDFEQLLGKALSD